MDNEELIYTWLQLNINQKYDDVFAKTEFWSADISKQKFRFMKNYSQETIQDQDRHEYLDQLHQQAQLLFSKSPEEMKLEIDKINHQDNLSE